MKKKSDLVKRIRKALPKPARARKMKSITSELWELCRELTFRTYGSDCYTCPARNLLKSNRQCGHAYPKGALGASMQYDLRILRPQCYHCNINLGGMGAVFWNRLQLDIGKADADALYLECQASKGRTTPSRAYYLMLIEKYKALVNL